MDDGQHQAADRDHDDDACPNCTGTGEVETEGEDGEKRKRRCPLCQGAGKSPSDGTDAMRPRVRSALGGSSRTPVTGRRGRLSKSPGPIFPVVPKRDDAATPNGAPTPRYDEVSMRPHDDTEIPQAPGDGQHPAVEDLEPTDSSVEGADPHEPELGYDIGQTAPDHLEVASQDIEDLAVPPPGDELTYSTRLEPSGDLPGPLPLALGSSLPSYQGDGQSVHDPFNPPLDVHPNTFATPDVKLGYGVDGLDVDVPGPEFFDPLDPGSDIADPGC